MLFYETTREHLPLCCNQHKGIQWPSHKRKPPSLLNAPIHEISRIPLKHLDTQCILLSSAVFSPPGIYYRLSIPFASIFLKNFELMSHISIIEKQEIGRVRPKRINIEQPTEIITWRLRASAGSNIFLRVFILFSIYFPLRPLR